MDFFYTISAFFQNFPDHRHDFNGLDDDQDDQDHIRQIENKESIPHLELLMRFRVSIRAARIGSCQQLKEMRTINLEHLFYYP